VDKIEERLKLEIILKFIAEYVERQDGNAFNTV